MVAVYLAAGKSSRMGENKLALPLGATTIGSSALQKALHSILDYIIVVTREGDFLNWIDSSLFQVPFKNGWTSITCKDSDKGQAHSLSCGLRAAMRMKPLGVMVLLADQPFLSERTINDLVLRYGKLRQEKESLPFIAASFQGLPKPPIVFSPTFVPQLLTLEGDEGARQLFRKPISFEGVLVDYENDWEFFDVDTKEVYEELRGLDTSHD